MATGLRARIAGLQAETLALYLAARHPATPWYARWLVAAIIAYALSPIDLIPDFIPVLGYLDDLILLPLGIALAISMIPSEVMRECRLQAQQKMHGNKPVSRAAAAVIVLIWLTLMIIGLIWLYRVLIAPRSAIP
jgi:uncharacterized membrane protein YkvA (DUF1232 family)